MKHAPHPAPRQQENSGSCRDSLITLNLKRLAVILGTRHVAEMEQSVQQTMNVVQISAMVSVRQEILPPVITLVGHVLATMQPVVTVHHAVMKDFVR
jgi:hypothetical protein